jgi:hypothetical protein
LPPCRGRKNRRQWRTVAPLADYLSRRREPIVLLTHPETIIAS